MVRLRWLLFPVAVLGVRRQWWSVGYAAELCGLGYFSFVRVCRLFRVKLFPAVFDDIEVIYGFAAGGDGGG